MKIPIERDLEKSKALLRMAEITLKRLKESDIKKYPSNSLVDYYTIIHELCEAISLSEGIKVKGDAAHFELINYVCEKHDFSISERQFLQDIRDYRNRISYEGFSISLVFIENNSQRIEEIINKLFEILNR